MASSKNSATNVTTGKPKVGGSIFRAPINTSLPTDAKVTLSDIFKNLGFISEDGVSNSDTRENEDIKSWGGSIVHSSQTEKKDTFKFTLLEVMNVDVLKTVYGEDNISGDLTTGITIKSNDEELEYNSYVIEMILKGKVLKRIVIPNAKIIELGEITYNDSDAIGYEVTLSTTPDEKGNTHYEYLIKGDSSVQS